jgi:transposase-like protein
MTDKRRRSFTREFKAEAVRVVHSRRAPVAAVARELGISGSTLRHWVTRSKGFQTAKGRPTEYTEDTSRARRGSKETAASGGSRPLWLVGRFGIAAAWLLTVALAWHANLLLGEQNSLIKKEAALALLEITAVQDNLGMAGHGRVSAWKERVGGLGIPGSWVEASRTSRSAVQDEAFVWCGRTPW